MKELIQQYAAYDLWANTRVVERLQREKESMLDHHVKSSFPSLNLTLAHIRDSTNAWRQRIFGGPAIAFNDAAGGLLKVAVAMNDQVRQLDDAALGALVTYARANGQQYTQPRWQLLVHCYNHASYHRGQLITIMRQLDMTDIPGTDLVAYQRLTSPK